MAQKIIAFVCAFLVLVTGTTHARYMGNYRPTDVTRFKQKIDFTVEGITTPKVVTYETYQSLGNFVALQKADTKDFISIQLNQTILENPWKLPILQASTLLDPNPDFIQDQNLSTFITFDSNPNKTIIFTNPLLRMPAKLELSLAPNTNPPEAISIQALFLGQSDWQTIVDRVPFRNTINFPQILPQQIKVQFHTPHLFRLAELEWSPPNRVTTQKNKISFYAQEGTKFNLFIQPSFGQNRIPTTLDSPTSSDQNTPVFNFPPAERNPIYNPDFDGDRISDTQDLCPRVADTTNADIDKNGLGDACEDPDQDGVNSYLDNCPFVENSDQTDKDQDEIGDACDNTENRFTEQSDWWINVSFGLMVLALLYLIGRSVWSKPKLVKKPKAPKKKSS